MRNKSHSRPDEWWRAQFDSPWPKAQQLELLGKAGGALRQAAVGCFIAGTLVHTKDGLKPIEQIQVGDWVLSRPDDLAKGTETGYKRVTKTFRFEDKEVIRFVWHQDTADGEGAFHSVFATPNHPVWSHSHGWVPMGRMHNVGRRIPGTVPINDETWWGRDLVVADGSIGQRYDVFDLFRTDRPEVAFDNDEEGSWGMGSLIDLSGVKPNFSADVPYDYEKWGDAVNETRQRYTATVYNLEVEDWHTYFVGEAGLWIHHQTCEDPALTVATGSCRADPLLPGGIGESTP